MVLVEMKEAADSRSESFMFQILGYPERVGQAKNVVLLLVIDQSFYEMNGCVTADKNKKIMVVVLTGLDLRAKRRQNHARVSVQIDWEIDRTIGTPYA